MLAIVLASVYLIWMALGPVATEVLPGIQNKISFNNAKLGNASDRGADNAIGVFSNLPYGILFIIVIIALYAVFTPQGGYQ